MYDCENMENVLKFIDFWKSVSFCKDLHKESSVYEIWNLSSKYSNELQKKI